MRNAQSVNGTRLSRTRGMVMVYTCLVMVVMLAFTSLAVDLARVQVAKSQLRGAADAAARIGVEAMGYVTSTSGQSTGQYYGTIYAQSGASDNIVDGTSLQLQTSDITYGTWNATTHVFTATTSNPNAMKVLAYRTAARSTAIPLTFAKIIGMSTCNISAQAIAVYSAAVNTSLNVPATSNPWLAGMPNGSSANVANNPHNNPDYAPAACPKQMTAMTLVPGQSLTFSSISGGANNMASSTYYGPDGNTTWITDNLEGAENGMGDLYAPINAVVGVFLDDTQPSLTAAPATLDFSTTDSRNFTSLAPQLKQPFFIGDGLTDSGVTQQFTVPTGATRLFIGTMDQYEWNNNIGSYTTTVYHPQQIQLVK